MYQTTLYNLSEDLEHASVEFGQRELGEINAEEMYSLLEFLRHLDPVEIHEAQPFISVTSALGRFTVRSTAGKLHLYDVTQPQLGSCELEPAALIQQITPQRLRAQLNTEAALILPKKSSRFNQSIAIVMLIGGLGLNGYTLYSTFYIDDVHRAPPLTLLTNASEAQTVRNSIAGYFATGNAPGDRAITIKIDGSAEILVIGTKQTPRKRAEASYTLGKRDAHFYLALKPRGQIEVVNSNTLMLYGDLYRRQ